MQESYNIFPLGDTALTIHFGNIIDDRIHQKVLQLFRRLKKFPSFIKDVVPAYSSLTIYYDTISLHTKEKTAFEIVQDFVIPLLEKEEITSTLQTRTIRIPVCYAKKFALDLE